MKDPYLKPIVFSGLLITVLSLIFILGIFLWSIIGGYVAVRFASKITKELISFTDGILIGLFTGILGGTCLDLLTMISFYDGDSRQSLIRTLERNWPKDISMPDINQSLNTLLLFSCLIIVLISVTFSVLGSYIAVLMSKKKNIIKD